ncbi:MULTISPECIES: class I SAM-dependent methyltransferase [unclassified Lebetimonas]|uniref:class I SAM-dependent methyltransferase n=1 Tax=unclassified Lebetimonas TaxID=2648158 RepID=UPI000464F9D4|nr:MULTISPECIES: methyltransferase domain-containing protein [unclassified Lebetimonas]
MLFDNLVKDYEEWFEKHTKIYEEELKTIKELLPEGKGIEIGVGTGRFAAPLGIKVGIEPSKEMSEIAKKRDIEVINITAEEMDFEEEFDFALIVTTICFVKDPLKTLQNTYKALKQGGFVIVAFVDLNSPLGMFYEKNKFKSKFYKEAIFFTKDDIIDLLQKAGFSEFECVENLYGEGLDNLSFEIKSCNGGAFKVIRGRK